MPFYTYILQSNENYHYTGHAADRDLRMIRHRLRTTHFTKKGTGWQMIYSMEFSTRSEAMRYEKWLKSGVGREWIKHNVAGCPSSLGSDGFRGPGGAAQGLGGSAWHSMFMSLRVMRAIATQDRHLILNEGFSSTTMASANLQCMDTTGKSFLQRNSPRAQRQ